MMIKNILVLTTLIYATIQDLKYREVSNFASLFILVIGLYKFDITNVMGLIITPMPLIITNIISKKESFGGADIKVIGSLGMCFGFIKSMYILFIALICCLLSNIIIKQEKRAFMPYILIGYVITIFIWRKYGS